MDKQLSSAILDANNIAEKALLLGDKLQKIASSAPQATSTGIDPLVFAVTIFLLAAFVGYYVVWKVTPSLHTPLMSITNAISGIIIIGALIATSPAEFGISSIFGLVAVFFASINIFGGFFVTERMLKMFNTKPKIK